MPASSLRQTLRSGCLRVIAMKIETWLARCAAELQHLQLTHPHGRDSDAAPDAWGANTAGELIEAQRYRGLDPVQAARVFWRDSE
jgi:hypothetical protein